YRLGDRRPRTRGARREAGIQRSGSARCAGNVTVAKPQRSGGDHGEESEESEVEDEETEVGEKSRAGPQEKERRGEEERRDTGEAEGQRACEAGRATARSGAGPGAVLPPSAALAADGRHVRRRQRRFGRWDLVTSPATKRGPDDDAGRLLFPTGEGAESAAGSAHGRLISDVVGPTAADPWRAGLRGEGGPNSIAATRTINPLPLPP